ncbi:hypothetical protein MHYP_G00094990 [Metynnis hypsauchen]
MHQPLVKLSHKSVILSLAEPFTKWPELNILHRTISVSMAAVGLEHFFLGNCPNCAPSTLDSGSNVPFINVSHVATGDGTEKHNLCCFLKILFLGSPPGFMLYALKPSLSLKLQLPQCIRGNNRKWEDTHVAFQNSAVERRKGMFHIFLT